MNHFETYIRHDVYAICLYSRETMQFICVCAYYVSDHCMCKTMHSIII